MADFEAFRDMMVDAQIAGRGVCDPLVLAAMREVPRERFVSRELVELAYEDGPLPIGEGQTISQPYIVAAMIEAAEVRPGGQVLEVGAGSGYAAAVLGRIAARVIAVERHAALADAARERMVALGYDNVEIRVGDGSCGVPEDAPFDAILVAAAGRTMPRALKGQLTVGGRLIVPVGRPGKQRLCKVTRVGSTRYEEHDLCPVAFVPLITDEGAEEDRFRLPIN